MVRNPATGHHQHVNVVPKPLGGVDKSDQMIGYYNCLRSTWKYWKMLLFHMLDIAAMNSCILFRL